MPDIQDCPNEQQAASGRAMCARSASYQIRVLTYVLGIFLAATGVVAEQQRAPLDREIWKKSQVFQPKPSFDTTPVTVKVVAVTYRIPRNYLTDLGPQLPAIKLAWPGLQPLTKENRECFGSVAQGQRAGCTSFNFLILGSGSPSGRDVSNSEKFESWQKSFPKLGTRRGPFGYDIHSVGPNEARTEVYRRVDGDIYFRCQLSEDRSRAVCNDMFRLDDMNHMQFYFRLEHIEHIASIEASMRKLVASFVLHKEE